MINTNIQYERIGLATEKPDILTGLPPYTSGTITGDSNMANTTNHPSGKNHHNYKHGRSKTITYFKWKRMRQRCNNPKDRKYPDYGERGIIICKRWDDYNNFLADMGECPTGLTLGRIDNNGMYCSKNCRWENGYQQANNTRKNHYVSFCGQIKTIAQWARCLNINYKALWKRVKVGTFPVKEARAGQRALFE